MLKLKYISQWGGTLDLVNNDLFTLTNVDGLTTAATDISSIVIGGVDGDFVNSMQAQPRGIIFDLRIKNGVNVESAKRAVLSIVKLKQKCSLEWTQNGRTLVINGVVDTVTMPRFNNEVTMQISIHCGEPFWEDLNDIISEISEIMPLQYFTDDPYDMLYFPDGGIPFSAYDTSRTRSFNNTGDVAVGMIIEIYALATVTNPIIYNQNGEFFGVGYGGKSLVMYEGDVLVINTKAGEKSVTLLRGGSTYGQMAEALETMLANYGENGRLNLTPEMAEQFNVDRYNLLNKIKPQSTWLQLQAGVNEFSIDSDGTATDDMIFSLIYKQRYI